MSSGDVSSFQQLLGQVRAGDREAAGEFWRQFEPELRRTIRVRLWQSGLQGRGETDDRIQSVALLFFDRLDRGKLDDRLDELESPIAALNLLKKMAQGRFIDWLRRRGAQRRDERKKHSLDTAVVDPSADDTSPSEAVHHAEQLEGVFKLLDETERRVAELLLLGRTWNQVADELEMNREVVRRKHYRAVHRLQHMLGRGATED